MFALIYGVPPNVNLLYSFHTILCRKSPKTVNSSPQFPPIHIFDIKNESNSVNYSQFFGACDRT